ncbi:MAG: hypothetical protein ACRDTE_28415 [Pseudonocardiaceae bacterium]
MIPAESSDSGAEVPPGRAVRDDPPGDPACWMARVCPDCGGLAETDPPTRCPRCGADMPQT